MRRPIPTGRVDIFDRYESGNTFNLVAEEYVQKLRDDGMAPATEKKTVWLLKQFENNLGPRPISEIEPFEVLEMLRKVERRGRLETAHRLRSFAGRVFRYAIWTSRAKADPTALLAGALRTPKVTNHAAITEAKPLGGLLRAIDAFEGHKPIGFALKLSPHVFVRPSELRKAEWPEFNLDEAYWRIPAEKMKMGREHWVPLSRQSVALLRELREITGNSPYLFPSIRTWLRPMSENAVNVALRRLGYGLRFRSIHNGRIVGTVRSIDTPQDDVSAELRAAKILAPIPLEKEMADLIRFKTSTLTTFGFQRNGVWNDETADQKVEHIGLMFGALIAAPDGPVRGYGMDPEALTFAILTFPSVWDWYLQWREQRRGFYTVWESDMLCIGQSLVREETGWLRQMPQLVNRLRPVGGSDRGSHCLALLLSTRVPALLKQFLGIVAGLASVLQTGGRIRAQSQGHLLPVDAVLEPPQLRSGRLDKEEKSPFIEQLVLGAFAFGRTDCRV